MGDENANGNAKTFLQADVDRIIGERVAGHQSEIRELKKQLKIAEDGLGSASEYKTAAEKHRADLEAERKAHAATRTRWDHTRAAMGAGFTDEDHIDTALYRYGRAVDGKEDKDRPAFADWLKGDGAKDPILSALRGATSTESRTETTTGGMKAAGGDPKPDARPAAVKQEEFGKFLRSPEYLALPADKAREAKAAKKKALGIA
jgi:hypothetical protein